MLSSASSPNQSPGPSLLTVSPPIVTVAVPLRTMKNPIPVPPSSVAFEPAWKVRSFSSEASPLSVFLVHSREERHAGEHVAGRDVLSLA